MQTRLKPHHLVRIVGVGVALFTFGSYLAPFIFGYVPAFSLDGSASDIVITFVLVLFGTWLYSWILSGIWLDRFKKEKQAV